MKKIYLSILSLVVLATFAKAQMVDVTFQIDMNASTVSPNGVHVAGSFQDEAGVPAEWTPGATTMTDANTDGIYDVTVTLDMTGAATDTFQYKFINDNDWPGEESVPMLCGIDNGFGGYNRQFIIGGQTAVIIPSVCFSTCDAMCPSVDTSLVTFSIDMSSVGSIEDTITIAGNFLNDVIGETWSDWTGGQFILDELCGTFYTGSVMLPTGNYDFKYQNDPNGWEGFPVNRTFSVPSDGSPVAVGRNLFDNRDTIVNVDVNVTLQADMRRQFINPLIPNPDTVIAAGSFGASIIGGGFNDWDDCSVVLLDGNADSIFDFSFAIQEGSYEYKFLNGCGGWEAQSNSAMLLDGCVTDTIIKRCFNRPTEDCGPILPPINVTFRVNMKDEIVASSGIFAAGSFQNPAWTKYVDEMIDSDGDKIYEFTASILPDRYEFRYFNGADSANTDVFAETADFFAMGCGVDNGVGSFNREIELTGIDHDTILPVWKYNSCTVDTVGTVVDTNTAILSLNNIELSIYPNPFSSVTNIEIPVNENGYQIQVVDVTGKTVLATTIEKGITTAQIERAHLINGVYIIRISDVANGASTAAKLILK